MRAAIIALSLGLGVGGLGIAGPAHAEIPTSATPMPTPGVSGAPGASLPGHPGAKVERAPIAPNPRADGPLQMFFTDAQVKAAIPRCKAQREAGQPMGRAQYALRVPGLHHMAVECRVDVTPPALHERFAEYFYIVEGSGTLVLGGKITNPRHTNSANWTGDAVEGGKSFEVKKGLYILVPENTVHWFSTVDKKLGLTVMVTHLAEPASDQH